MDLVDWQKLKEENEGQRYLFTCIDVFSKLAWALPIKDKTGKANVAVLKSIIVKSGRKPKDIVMDNKEHMFLRNTFLQFLKSQSICFFTTENGETEAAVIERWHRTFKNKMFRYFPKTRQHRYLDVLQDLVRSYNFYHRSTKISPVSAHKQNQEEVLQALYGSLSAKIRPPKLKGDDTVRLAQAR